MSLTDLLDQAAAARAALFDPRHEGAFRLFNGFSEGWPALAIDLYAATALLHDYADPPENGAGPVAEAEAWLRARLPWLRAALVKSRHAATPAEKNGRLLFGEAPDRKVREHGVWYALDLTLNRDASLYLDTRNLRRWAIDHLEGKRVLNTFAYTGSLGVAALAGRAAGVLQLDRSRAFLNLAKTSCSLNGFPIRKADFLAGDFFAVVQRLKRTGARFDCVFIDPPFFSSAPRGTVDLIHGSGRLINKVRPLIADGGWLVAVNNALYVSGRDYMAELETLCADGYLEIAELVPVPSDFIGVGAAAPITDPAPFNHATKIAVLKVRRKAG